MAWHHVADEETVAPEYVMQDWIDKRGRFREHIGKQPTGGTITKTHSIWKCGPCGARAVTSQGERPSGDCGKCGARGTLEAAG